MAIQKAPTRLDAEDIDRGDEITEQWIKDAMRNLNALYEALFDATAPGDSGQGYHGHDHFYGGGPICRGVLWGEDGGNDALYAYEPTTPLQKYPLDYYGTHRPGGMARYFASPLFGFGAKAPGRLYYTAVNSDFTLYFTEISGNALSKKSPTFEVSLPITGEVGAWVDFEISLNPGKWNQLDIYAENATYDASNAPVLRVFAINIAEAPGATLSTRRLQMREGVATTAKADRAFSSRRESSVINVNEGEKYKAHIKAQWGKIARDLAARGISDAHIEGLHLDTDIDTDLDPPVRGWEFTVNLKQGPALVYRIDNADGATLRRLDGQPMQGGGEAN